MSLDISVFKIPYTDFKQGINKYFVQLWQTDWNNKPTNKLNIVKPTLGDTTLRNILKRRDEVVLHRARIGHTHLTHCYLLQGEDQPECIPCGEQLTVEHILVNCLDFAVVRQKYYSTNNLNELFNTVTLENVINFLKDIKLYDKF